MSAELVLVENAGHSAAHADLLERLDRLASQSSRRNAADSLIPMANAFNPRKITTIEDVATGIVHACDIGDLDIAWGVWMMTECECDFEDFEGHPDWDRLLDALWDISFGIRPEAEAMEAARRLARGF